MIATLSDDFLLGLIAVSLGAVVVAAILSALINKDWRK